MAQFPHIYGTLGPACAETGTLAAMLSAGMDGIRINLSHGTLAAMAEGIAALRAAEAVTERKAEILIDLQGPELRLGDLKPCFVGDGELLTLGEGGIPFPSAALRVLEPGDILRVDDGLMQWQVLSVDSGSVLAEVLNGGELLPRKSVALPEGRDVRLPVLSSDDELNLRDAVSLGIRQVMMPFVHSLEDILAVRRFWAGLSDEPLTIFAKLEDPEGVEKLDSFLSEADVIVIARGDLGSHVPLPTLPALQMEISRKCRESNKPFLVVTQMLNSMMRSPVPTRAEVTDIAYAVESGAHAVMLTGETAAGQYPVESMRVFAETVRYTYEYLNRK